MTNQSSEIAIDVDNVSKIYKIWTSPAARLRGPLVGRLGQLPFLPPSIADWCLAHSQGVFRHFYALRDVSFSFYRGETIGIIGRNGSGKSTLLQIIAGTLTPTTGSVTTTGRVSALLELGSGFNPDFTGRENVYLNASILGLDNSEIDRCYDRIESFADIGDFIDQPVKTYSSGMVVRLAFAVASNVAADVLIVDEALSVGDEAFQRKCYSYLHSFRERGGTILFVSHAASVVVELCDRAILLDHGELITYGRPKDVVTKYHKLLYAPPERAAALREEFQRSNDDKTSTGALAIPEHKESSASRSTTTEAGFFDPHLVSSSVVTYDSRGALLDSPRILTLGGQLVNVVPRGGEYIYEYRVRFVSDCYGVRFGMLITTTSGFELGGSVTSDSHDAIPLVNAGTTALVRFRFRTLLAPGVYFFNAGVIGIVDGAQVYLHRLIDICMLRVQPQAAQRMTGLIDFCIVPEFTLQPAPDRPA